MSDCFVHASDLHLDAPLGNLGLLGKEKRLELARKAETAWGNLVELCVEREASFLVLAGDVFDDAAASFASQRRLHDGLTRLSEQGVKVFICHGNHDPLSEGFRSLFKLPEGVVRFPSDAAATHEVALRRSGDEVCVSGISFATRTETRNLALQFADVPAQAGRPHIAVLHANLGGDSNHDNYAPCSKADLSAADVDYWALGHIHQRRVVDLGAGRRAAYCGNLQGRSFKPSECQPKGALVIPVERGSLGTPEFAACDAVRFVRSSVEVSPDESLRDVLAGIELLAESLGGGHGGRPVALRTRLVGRSSIDVCRELREHFAADGAWREDAVWLGRLEERLNGGGLCGVGVAVRDLADREQLKAVGDLRASVLEELDDLCGVTVPAPTISAGDASVLEELDDLRGCREDTQRLRDRLFEMLPASSGLRKVWTENCSDRLGDAADLAEELLLEVFAGGESR